MSIDQRTAKAFHIWQAVATWIVFCDAAGSPVAFGIPSESREGVYYRTTDRSCECRDAERGNTCKHIRAVQMRVQEVASGQARAG